MKKKGEKKMAKLTPMKAIRAKCLDCTCGQFNEVRECTVVDCPLYEYRMGHRPKNSTPSEGLSEENSLGEEV
jgi:hypothetical protein